MRDMYALFHQSQADRKFSGIFSGQEADEISLSSVPEGLQPKAILYFNKDGYSVAAEYTGRRIFPCRSIEAGGEKNSVDR